MLSCRLEGSGDPLLLVHGWGVSTSVWDELVPRLAPRFRLILIEAPGLRDGADAPRDLPYYDFFADQLEALRREMGIDHWAILAYSVGTRAAELYIQRYPQHVTHAAFICPMRLSRTWAGAIAIGQRLNATFPRLANWWISGWRLRGWLLAVGFNGRHSALANRWASEIAQRPLETLKRMLLEIPTRGRAPITAPDLPPSRALYIWGRHDALVPYPRRPRSNDVFVAAGHGAPMLAPEFVAAAALLFLERSHPDVQSGPTSLSASNEPHSSL
jgi:pimeloyl-ACP methyl ester carboxylesterase